MVGFIAGQCIQERLVRRLVTTTTRFDSDKDSVNLSQLLGVVKAHHPPAIRFIVHIENSEVHGRCLLALRSLSLAPHLERAGIDNPWLTVEIECVKNKRLALRG